MSVHALNEALFLLKESGTRVFELGPASEQEVAEFSEQIGGYLPTSYIEFLKRCSSLSALGVEFYGLIPEDLYAEEIPNALWLTRDLSENSGLPKSMLVVEDLGDGNYACLALSKSSETEAPVVVWDSGLPDHSVKKLEILAPSFGDYVQARVKDLLA